MSAIEFLKKAGTAEVAQLKQLQDEMIRRGTRDKALPRTLKLTEDLDRAKADKDDLQSVTAIDYTNTLDISGKLRPVYEAQRARRDINLGRASRTQRIVAGLSALNVLRYNREYDLNNRRS